MEIRFSSEGTHTLLIRSHFVPDVYAVAWHQRDSRDAFQNALRDTSQTCHAIRSKRLNSLSESQEHFGY